MGGKGSLLLVLGYSLIFMVIGFNFNSVSTEAIDSASEYFSKTTAHDIALSGANIGITQLYRNKDWTPGADYSNIPYNDGNFTVSLKDTLDGFKIIRSSAFYNNFNSGVKVLLKPINYAKYGNFYNVFNAAAATGDTFSGPFHSNDFCSVHGNPVFWGKVTCLKGLRSTYAGSDPKFYGGFESGVYIPLEFDTTGLRMNAEAGGIIFKGTSEKPIIELDFDFNNNGTVTYKQRMGTGSVWDVWSSPVTVSLPTLTPNGLIYIEKGNVQINGVLNGQVTIVTTSRGAGSSVGNIFITDDIKYNSNPLTNTNSNDLMGLIAEQKVEVTFNNSRGDIDVQASVYAQKDGFSIASYGSYTSVHNLNILGGVIAQQTKPTADYYNAQPIRGYRFVHRYDERFLKKVPPFFPHTKKYEIVSWLE